jgi:hypothetical protein
VNIGNADAFEAASNHSPGFLLGSAIDVHALQTIAFFGVIGKKPGARIVMAVYTSRDGEPDSLVAFTEPTPVEVGVQRVKPSANETLAPGTYWLVAVFDRQASIGYDMSDKSAVVKYVVHRFAAPLPDRFRTLTTYTGQRFNYFLEME